MAESITCGRQGDAAAGAEGKMKGVQLPEQQELERGGGVMAESITCGRQGDAAAEGKTKGVQLMEQQELEHSFAKWKSAHPSILDNFDEWRRSAKGKRLAIFLDYDGTLTPIVRHPERAFMDETMRAAVKKVATRYPTAIISGRGRQKVFEFVQLSELVYAGSHGMDIASMDVGQGRGGAAGPAPIVTAFCPAQQFEEQMGEVHLQLAAAVHDIKGATVENNKFCVSVHFRNCDSADLADVEAAVQEVVAEYPSLHVTYGRKVLEVRPSIEWDKGKALRYLLGVFGMDQEDVLALYIGDDKTDEDAFRVLRDRGDGRGCGILVSTIAKETDAHYTLGDPAEVLSFLTALASAEF